MCILCCVCREFKFFFTVQFIGDVVHVVWCMEVLCVLYSSLPFMSDCTRSAIITRAEGGGVLHKSSHSKLRVKHSDFRLNISSHNTKQGDGLCFIRCIVLIFTFRHSSPQEWEWVKEWCKIYFKYA